MYRYMILYIYICIFIFIYIYIKNPHPVLDSDTCFITTQQISKHLHIDIAIRTLELEWPVWKGPSTSVSHPIDLQMSIDAFD